MNMPCAPLGRHRGIAVGLTAMVAIVMSLLPAAAPANPWNGKIVLQAFWWDCWNQRYPQDWYTYLAKLAPRLKALGVDGIWIPSPAKGNAGVDSMGYDIFDHYDLGDKDQKGTVATRFGSKDSLLRLIAVAHANGLDVYPDIVLNQVMGGDEDSAAPGDRFKRFRYWSFAGPERGRWPKDHWNFHPNPDHWCSDGDICEQKFGPDVCYLDTEHGGGGNGHYMRDQSRAWLVWLSRQLGVDGFRFDAVKHFEPDVVEDLLYNTMGDRLDYFSVGEFVGSREQEDAWADAVRNRSGTFDFALRDALANLVEAGGYFDMGSLPNRQQLNRFKTSPFINNHDTWRGAYWDSANAQSRAHDDRDGDWRLSGEELAPTIDPDNPRSDVAYAAAFAVDGSPTAFYEDLFVNDGAERFNADPATLPTRPYLVNLIWARQKLDFKDGAYKVRYQGSSDLLVIERSSKALIGLNDNGAQAQEAWVQTDFPPHTSLHDYAGGNGADLVTDDHGWVRVSVAPMSYAVWGPAGIDGGFSPAVRSTTQEFQLDDDLGDARPNTPGDGGRIEADQERVAGAIWAAPGSLVKVWLYTDGERDVGLRVYNPDAAGARSRDQGDHVETGKASDSVPLFLTFIAEREGYFQLAAKLMQNSQAPTRAYVKVEYQGPAVSEKF